MRIICLIENTCESGEFYVEHGLSLYIETENHKILCDTGASDKFIRNAEKLGVDLSAVDCAVLSHGHYDHCGGVGAFSILNNKAKIYINSAAFGEYYHFMKNEKSILQKKYIGIDKKLLDLPNMVLTKGDYKINDEAFILHDVKAEKLQPLTNCSLKCVALNGVFCDDFAHEQYLEVKSANKTVLISGCAHKGIVNIIEAYKNFRGYAPDVVISGFHTVNRNGYSEREIKLIYETGKELMKYKTRFYTCHCTGEKPYEILKSVMGEQISYISSGKEIHM